MRMKGGIKMEIYERIRVLRKEHLHMSQTEFAEKLGVTRSVINNIERNVLARPDQKEPFYRLICTTFNINYEWLTNGIAPMKLQTKDAYIEQLAERYNGGEIFKKVIEAFISLNDEERKAVLKFIDNLDPEPTESILSGSNLKLNELENVPSYARSQDDTSPAGKQIPKSEIKAALAERAKDDDDL